MYFMMNATLSLSLLLHMPWVMMTILPQFSGISDIQGITRPFSFVILNFSIYITCS